MAAMQTQLPNTKTFRTFEYIYQRLSTYYESQLSYLGDELHKVDVAESKTMMGVQKVQVPFNKQKFAHCCLDVPDSPYVHNAPIADHDDTSKFTTLRENLFAEIESVGKKHRMFPLHINKARITI
jgi:hypothetical protein